MRTDLGIVIIIPSVGALLIGWTSRHPAPLNTWTETNFVSLLYRPEDNQPYVTLPFNDHKITSAVWGPLGEFVIAGHENGEINQISAKVRRRAGSQSGCVGSQHHVTCASVWLIGSLGRSWRKPRSTPGTSTTSRLLWTWPCSSAPPRTTLQRWEPTESWLDGPWKMSVIASRVKFCLPPVVRLNVPWPHQDLQDGETRQLCRYLSYHGSCKWTINDLFLANFGNECRSWMLQQSDNLSFVVTTGDLPCFIL